jgi:Flp pilus assembly protein TadG
MRRFFKQLLKLGRLQEGVAALEFALCLIPLLLIVGGIMDYGQLWYMESVLATASREGARYATRYQTDPATGVRLAPSALTPSVQSYVSSKYAGLLPDDANLTVTPGDTGYTSTTQGAPVKIQVTAEKHWFFLGNFLPIQNPQLLSSSTVMSLE